MILDKIIEQENKVIKSKGRLPRSIKMNYYNYCLLIREIESNYFLNKLHNIPIHILPINKIIVE